MGWAPKKAKTEEGPYVPPMGDPGLRGVGASQGPKVATAGGPELEMVMWMGGEGQFIGRG